MLGILLRNRPRGLLLLILAPLPSAAAVDVAADHPFIQYSGRFDFANPKKPRCDWPGVSILARFTGKSITVKIGGGSNDFNVIVDGAWKAKLGTDGKTSQVAAEGLADGEHTLLLTKRTEGNQGITTFEGFQLEVGKALLEPPARPAKKIEFIGDSYTVGYGDEAEVLSCPDRRPFDNNYAAYGPVAARAVNAEYSVQAISGLGMVHNYGDPVVLSDKPFPGYYENTLFGSGAPLWDHSKWQPDIVTVALGTNDFSTSVKPSESQYSGAYKEFLKKIRGWYPAAEIICITFSGDAYQKKYVDTLVSQVVRQGDAKIHRLHMPELGDTDLGCDYHPNVSGQLKYADALIPVIRQYLGTVDIRNPEPGSKRTVAIAGPIKKTSRIRYRREKPPGEWKDAGGRSLLLPSLEKVPAGIEGALDKP